MKPTPKEIEEIFNEEKNSALAYALICDQENILKVEKIKARNRMVIAREKRSNIYQDLMSL